MRLVITLGVFEVFELFHIYLDLISRLGFSAWCVRLEHRIHKVGWYDAKTETGFANFYTSPFLPRTQLTPIFEGQPSKTRPCSIKTRVIWVLGIH